MRRAGATLHRGARASLSWLLLLWSTGSTCAGSAVVAHGLSCSAACGIFPDQGSNPCPLHWQADSQPLRHQGSPGTFLWLNAYVLGAGLCEPTYFYQLSHPVSLVVCGQLSSRSVSWLRHTRRSSGSNPRILEFREAEATGIGGTELVPQRASSFSLQCHFSQAVHHLYRPQDTRGPGTNC